jgi:hypothetical protein
MYTNPLPLLLLLGQQTQAAAVLRFGCSQIAVERLDPYVDSIVLVYVVIVKHY